MALLSTLRGILGAGAGNLFVIVGETGAGQRSSASTNGGLTWSTALSVPSWANQGFFLEYYNGQFLTGGGSGQFAKSSNPVNSWASVTNPGITTPRAAIFAAGKWIVGGNTGGNSVIYTSADLVTWTERTITFSGSDAQDVTGLAASSSIIVAVGSAGGICTSTDGITWTQRTSPANNLTDVAYNGTNLFVASGDGGSYNILTSADGITWTDRSLSPNDLRATCVAFGSGRWNIGATRGTGWRALTSTDGINFSEVAVASISGSVYDIEHYRGFWVMVGQDTTGGNVGLIARSTNGTSWSLVSSHPFTAAVSNIGLVRATRNLP